jgi:hypothetical protein
VDKFWQRIEAKLDALLKAADIDPEKVVPVAPKVTPPEPRKPLTRQEQGAIDAAPKTLPAEMRQIVVPPIVVQPAAEVAPRPIKSMVRK